MVKRLTPDICVIGAGSGGLSVAAAAAAFGVGVVLIEKGEMGGDCLNYGCVPSKALLAAGKHARSLQEARAFGLRPQGAAIARKDVNAHVESVIAAIQPNDSQERFTAMGVQVIRETARFKDSQTVIAGDAEIRARRFVIATGSSPFVPPIEGLSEVAYHTNETIFQLARKPAHLAVIGGGPIGMEMAQAHLRLGSRVTVIEAQKALGKEDPEMSEVVLRQLQKEGVEILEGAEVTKVARQGRSGVRLTCRIAGEAREIDASELLVAVGRKPNLEELGLEAAGIRHDGKGLVVDARLRTTNARVYAVGDVAGALQFTHVAGYHAGQVIRSILFRFGGKVDHAAIPRVTFTAPELAHVGQTESEARNAGGPISVLRWPYHENDRAQAERSTIGHIKLVVGRGGRIRGVSIVGAAAGEMIHFWTLAIGQGLKLRDITGYVAPYPTFSEIGRRAAMSYYAPMARKPLLRMAISLLRRFG